MSHKIRIGVQIQQAHSDYPTLRRAVTQAEELGVDIIFNWDHFYALYGDPEGANYEGLATITAWAEQTSKVEIGNLVVCNSYRNPNLLADMARTIDHISGGRFILGIGSGWFERDYTEYGYPFGTAGSRLDDLARDLPIILDRFDKLNPQPLRKIPILIGGGGEKKTLPLAAKYADIWHYFVDEESYKRKSALLNQYCQELGRDPQEIEHSAGLDRARKDPVAIVEDAKRLHDLSVTLFTVGVGGPDYDFTPVEALIRWRDSVNS